MPPTLRYYPGQDVLYLPLAEGPEAFSRTLAPHITSEFGTDGTLLGIEMLSAMTVVHALLDQLLEARGPEAAEAGLDRDAGTG